MVKKINTDDEETYTLSYPIGNKPDKTPLLGEKVYGKAGLVNQYEVLANNKLAKNGVYQLVIIVEAVLGDLIRKVLIKNPNKIGNKRSIKSRIVFSCD